MTRRVWRYIDGVAYELGTEPVTETHHVMGDIEPFQSPDGAYITGRRQWREHLKVTDSIELSHADMKASQENWQRRKADFRAKLESSANTVREAAEIPVSTRPYDRSRLATEMLNRLHGKPEPMRKELIKLTLDIAKRMNRGR
jgi:hypothetical protein